MSKHLTSIRNKWRQVCAGACILAVSTGLLSGCGSAQTGAQTGNQAGQTVSDSQVAAAAYPAAVAESMDPTQFMESDEHWNWWEAYREKADASSAYRESMNDYYQAVMKQILVSDGENTVCSPLNTFIALAMLAEVSDGETRQQILDVLQVPDIESLRGQIKALWESNYIDTPTIKSLLANSLWLCGSTNYNNETLRLLAEQYYASSFSGDPGSDGMSEALRKWTDDNTGKLLTEYTKDLQLDPETVLAIVSTIYYKAAWIDRFSPENTRQETFHGTDGDTTVEMMHRTDMMGVYRTDSFAAVGMGINDSGTMYFFLPEEGVDVNTLLEDPDVLDAAGSGGGDRWSYPEVNLSVPKFRVSAKTDLLESLRELGIQNALDPSLSDFTPLTKEEDELFLSTAVHAAMVEVDEEGVTGAAYTELALAKGAALPAEEIDFVLDRPFLFVITGGDGSVLFSGIVRNIE